VLRRSAFVEWYVKWMFSADEGEDEVGEASSGDEREGSGEVAAKDLWGAKGGESGGSGSDVKTWKCDRCTTPNLDSSVKCAACGEARPGASATPSAPAPAPALAPAPATSAGPTGFGAAKIVPGGF